MRRDVKVFVLQGMLTQGTPTHGQGMLTQGMLTHGQGMLLQGMLTYGQGMLTHGHAAAGHAGAHALASGQSQPAACGWPVPQELQLHS